MTDLRDDPSADAPISPDEGTQGEGDAAMAEDDPLAEIPFWPVS